MDFYDKNPRYNALRQAAVELALKNLGQVILNLKVNL